MTRNQHLALPSRNSGRFRTLGAVRVPTFQGLPTLELWFHKGETQLGVRFG